MKIYDKTIAKEFQIALSFIDEVYDDMYEKLKSRKMTIENSKLSAEVDGEYGFYLNSKDKKSNIFVGIWIDYWVQTGNPICMTFDTYSRLSDKKYALFKSFLKENSKIFDSPIKYDEILTVAIKSETIALVDGGERFAKLLYKLFILLDFLNVED